MACARTLFDVLRHWAGKIKGDFDARYPDNGDPGMQSIKSLLGRTNQLLQKLLSEVQASRVVSDDHTHMIEHLENTTATLIQQICQQGNPQRHRPSTSIATVTSNEEGCTDASTFLQGSHSNSLQNASPAKRGRDELAIETPASAPATKRPSSMKSASNAAPAFLSHSCVAESAGESSMKIPLFQIIFDLYQFGLL